MLRMVYTRLGRNFALARTLLIEQKYNYRTKHKCGDPHVPFAEQPTNRHGL